MKNFLLIFLVISCLFCNPVLAQTAPSIEWAKCLGGYSEETAYCVQQVSSGGYIVAAYALSNDGDVSGNNSLPYTGDFWIVKLDDNGNIEWQECLGGTYNEGATSIKETPDGGFIVAGFASSNDGDVSGNHSSTYFDDYWVIKIDNTGNLLWQKCFGGSNYELPADIQLTIDRGFIVAGFSQSNDGDVTGHHGANSETDYWITRLDSTGDLLWQKSLGGTANDFAYSIQQTTDSGFIVAGYSNSNDGDVTGNHGGWDYWIVKLNSSGNLVWEKSLGGTMDEGGVTYLIPNSIQQTSDGGFIVAGFTHSNDGDVTGNHGNGDAWIVKLDSNGNILWQKALGGSNGDGAYSVQQTIDGGFIIAGMTTSNNYDVSGNHQPLVNGDYWIVKLDSIGNLIWQKCLGGSQSEWPFYVRQTTDGGFVLAGYSNSTDGDVTGLHVSIFTDGWIVKLSPEIPTGIASPLHNFISLSPNPVKSQLNINLTTPAIDVSILVYDVQGRIRQAALSGETDKIELNTENLPAGFYTLQIVRNKTGECEVSKFVKQ